MPNHVEALREGGKGIPTWTVLLRFVPQQQTTPAQAFFYDPCTTRETEMFVYGQVARISDL
ncbi:hypothetical protein L218DRAFT_965468 [Marasmius fiardii PR-910]|nr:hypothetical protein L218DRAFT_965468 [Marasmius fiardii PR-910]